MMAEERVPFDPNYHEAAFTREQVLQMSGPRLLEFGASWCGICRRFAPRIGTLLDEYPQVQHLKVEDGPGKRLGRSFGVKLWPTLVFLRDGQILKQVSRPADAEIREALDAITAEPA